MVLISSEASILSKRAFSTFRILPCSGRIAWNCRSRPFLAEPPAESPSTRNSSDERGVALRAVGELAGQVRGVERALAAGEVARLARGLAGARGLDALLDDPPRLARVLLEVLGELLVDHLLDPALDLGGDQLVLGLRGELGVLDLDRDDGRQPLAHVVAGEVVSLRSFVRPDSAAYSLMARVSAALKPSRWVPPSRLLIVLVKV